MTLLCVAGWAVLALLPESRLEAEYFTKGKQVKALTPSLATGDYAWKPEVSPSGPVVILVSIPEQMLYVYRNGVRIGRSTISSGRAGHDTPTGVFTILQKNVKHVSTIYKGAEMPYMERLTWGGIALHAGDLPGFPASHGCVRLPLDFAQKLYTVTTTGTTVIISGGKASPQQTIQPGLLLGGNDSGDETDAAAGGFTWTPEKSPSGPVSILYSAADRQVYVYRNGVEIGRGAVAGPGSGKAFGNHVYVALDQTDLLGNRQWTAVGSANGSGAPDLRGLVKQLQISPDFLAQVRGVVVPGTTLVVTDVAVNRGTQSKPGFNILTTEPDAASGANIPTAPPVPVGR